MFTTGKVPLMLQWQILAYLAKPRSSTWSIGLLVQSHMETLQSQILTPHKKKLFFWYIEWIRVPCSKFIHQPSKAYDEMSRLRLLTIYNHWIHQQIVSQQSGSYGPSLHCQIRCHPGRFVSLAEFNIAAGSMVHHWLTKSINNIGVATTEGLGMTVCDKLAIFYTDKVFLTSFTKVPWLQQSPNILFALLHHIGVKTKVHLQTKMIYNTR